MAENHVVFLAFANASGDLPELREERRQLLELFDDFQRQGRCRLVFKPDATIDQIYGTLNEFRNCIALFHFGGHAGPGQLLLDSALGQAPAHDEGLAELLGRQRGLKLVFLNGCSTRPQVRRLCDAGVPAVIATARAIDDHMAREFSVAFYRALTVGDQGIDAGQSIAAAFAQAQGFVKASRGGRTRDFIVESATALDVVDDLGFPWEIQYRPGSEHVGRWDLFEDDPLFGLPKLPEDIGLTKTLAREYARKGVTVNAVAPGFIRTRMVEPCSRRQRRNRDVIVCLSHLRLFPSF